MHRQRYRCMASLAIVGTCSLIAAPALAGGGFVTYTNQSNARMQSDAAVGLADGEEKDYAWGDIDLDGDTDLVSVRKQLATTAGGRRNVLFMNNDGVLVDETNTYIPEFMDATNDRDVLLVDVNNDGWLDLVTAAACNGCNPGAVVSQSRLYMNLGDGGDGTWDGFDSYTVLFTGNNFCAVGNGDVDGDGYQDLYFASYNDSTEDQMLMNQGAGNPGGFVSGNNRLTAAMRASGFGTHVEMRDMDNDGDLDIVKSENGPVEIFRNNGSGVFDLLDPTYSGAAYHFETGDLNNDGLLDIVIADDAVDRGILNNGNLINGAADPTFLFPSSTNGFGSNTVIIDLDEDGDQDIIISDVDVDAPSCSGLADMLENNSGGASYTFNNANIPDNLFNGLHDIAVMDVDGDTFLDLVVGRCDSTQVWINSPPISVEFAYPGGLPGFLPPGADTTFTVELTAIGDTIDPGSETLFVSVDGAPFTSAPLTPLGGAQFEGTLPGVDCTQQVSFYISATMQGGLSFFDPAAAPGQTYDSTAADGTALLYENAFEVNTNGWTVTNDPSLLSGAWEAVDPNIAFSGTNIAQPDNDATPSGTIAFITENGPAGGQSNLQDVDEGPTVLTSPIFDLDGTDGLVSYNRWVYSEFGIHDSLVVEISNDGGSTWTLVESVASTNGGWAPNSFFASEVIATTAQMRVRFSISDIPNDSVTEGGIDDFRVDILSCEPGKDPCPWDLDGGGTIDTVDFLDLLAQWGTNPGGPPDFNGDNVVDTIDFLELLANWGSCP